MSTKTMKCTKDGCDHIGTVKWDEGWLCTQHDQSRKALEHRQHATQGYMQTIYVQYVARGSALEEAGPEAARSHLRWLKAQARIAAEVLFEEKS